MIAVIVPSHNQGTHIENIVRSYENQTLRPDILLFVFDRCSDNSVDIISNIITDLNVSYTVKTKGDNFSAGMTRDYGLSKLSEEYSVIIFTDGDCYPNETVVEDHYLNCTIRSEPIVSCGRRMMQDVSGTYHEDERMNVWANGFSFVPRNGRVLLSTRVTQESIFTYSCSLAFNKYAIELCKDINYKLSGERRVFNPEFDGNWGGEDNFISDCLFRAGYWITLTDYRSYVKHPYHKPSDVKDDRSLIWKMLSKRLKDLILSGEIEGQVTIAERCRHLVEPLRFGGILNNIFSVTTDMLYTNYADLYFHSRNFVIIPPKEDRRIGKKISEIEYSRLYDLSAYRKHYLISTGVETDDDVSGHVYPRKDLDGCLYCKLAK